MAATAQVDETLLPWTMVGKHAMFPEAKHDEAARFNFLMTMNKQLAAVVGPGIDAAYKLRVEPEFRERNGRMPKDRHEVRRALKTDSYYQMWSALRRNNMEMRQQNGRSMVLRQINQLNEKAAALNAGKDSLVLAGNIDLPNYLAKVDHHCMPGSYHTELVPEDVSAAANYDSGLFCTTAGALGSMSDGGGRAVAQFVKSAYPDFKPKKILDLGCGLGHNVLPIAAMYPDAEVVAIDTGAPMLRYGHARAQALGITNVTFMQMDGEKMPWADETFDWVQTTMFWHETAKGAMERMLAATTRLLKKGGLSLHVEQPQYGPDMPLLEQALRDWDAFYNNEPFWSQMHEINLLDAFMKLGFKKEDCFEANVKALPDRAIFKESATDQTEDRGRAAAWTVFGAFKR